MTGLNAAIAVLVPSWVIYVALTRAWRQSPAPLSRALAIAVAPGLALGIASCLYFLLLLVRDRNTAVALDAGFWLAAALWLFVDQRRRARKSVRLRTETATWNSTSVIAAVGFFVMFGLSLLSVLAHWVASPHGTWDTIAIWDLRARAIARNGPNLTAIVSPSIGWSHPEYPLLLPSTIARLWEYSGLESVVVPAVVASLFLVSTLAVLVVSTGRSRGWTSGLMAGMAMLVARTYVAQVSCMCADVPIGFFLLVAVCFAATSRQFPQCRSLLIIAGATAGFAAWTKDEGIVFLVVLCVFVFCDQRGRRRIGLSHLLLGAAIPAMVVTVFKGAFAPPGFLFSGQTASTIALKLVDESRWSLVGSRFAELLPGWGEVPGGALAGVALAVALTARPDRQSARRTVFALSITVTMLLSYAAVYVITPADVRWQIATSFDRLVTQVWPTVVWAGFQLTGDRRESVTSGAGSTIAPMTA